MIYKFPRIVPLLTHMPKNKTKVENCGPFPRKRQSTMPTKEDTDVEIITDFKSCGNFLGLFLKALL